MRIGVIWLVGLTSTTLLAACCDSREQAPLPGPTTTPALASQIPSTPPALTRAQSTPALVPTTRPRTTATPPPVTPGPGRPAQTAVAPSIPDCPADRTVPLFDVAPLQMSDLLGIVPLGNLAPPDHTFPTQHLYFFIRRAGADPLDFDSPPAAVPVFSPGHVWLTSLSTSEHLSATPPFIDYSLDFKPCHQFMAYFFHVQTLSDDLLDRIGPLQEGRCETYSTGGQDYRLCNKRVLVEIQAGEPIGTAGRLGQNALGFGAYDGRATPLAYASPSRHGSRPDGLGQLHVVCAVDYFTPDVRDGLVARLGDHSGNRSRTIGPVCGEVEQDEPGTAQGKWYRKATVDQFPEDPHLALVHDNVDSSTAAFSVGTSVSGLRPGVYHFSPRESGSVNLDFRLVTPDGMVYCYDSLSLRGSPMGSLAILVELTGETALRIERQEAAECGTGPWILQSGYADFER